MWTLKSSGKDKELKIGAGKIIFKLETYDKRMIQGLKNIRIVEDLD
jgi:hypothetical protein